MSSSSYTLTKYEQLLLPGSSGMTFQQRFKTARRVGSLTLQHEDEKLTVLFTVHQTETSRLFRIVLKSSEIDELREQLTLTNDNNEVAEIERKIADLANGVVMIIEASQSKQTGVLYIENMQKVMRSRSIDPFEICKFFSASMVAIARYRLMQSIYLNIGDNDRLMPFGRTSRDIRASVIFEIVISYHMYPHVHTEEWNERDRNGDFVNRKIMRFDMTPEEVLRLQKLKQNK